MRERLPEYLKRPIIDTDKTRTVRKILKTKCLNTVCENARCPNKNECYTKNTATFLIMGNVCTRNCRYCNISCERPEPLDVNEPMNVAKAVADLGLKYSVITSVTRDDLSDGGAFHFADVITEIRKLNSNIKIEVLRHSIFSSLMLVLMLISSLIEVYCSTNLFIILLKNT